MGITKQHLRKSGIVFNRQQNLVARLDLIAVIVEERRGATAAEVLEVMSSLSS